MNGLETRYLHYEKSGKSEVTIPRKILKPSGFDWQKGDNISLIVKELEGKKGLFLTKEKEGDIRYLHYKKTNRSSVTIPRAILEFNNLDWKHGDIIILVLKEIEGKKGLFLRKDDNY